jgi:hypothetical protein
MNKLKIIYEIVFNLKKSVLCSTMLKTISFAQSCTLEVYIGIGNLNCILRVLTRTLIIYFNDGPIKEAHC